MASRSKVYIRVWSTRSRIHLDDTPPDLKDILGPNERLELYIRQKIYHPKINIDSVVITSERIILRHPHALGLKKDYTDFNYQDIANVVLDKGVIRSTIKFTLRFGGDPMSLNDLPNSDAEKAYGIIRENLVRFQAPFSGGVSSAPPFYPAGAPPQGNATKCSKCGAVLRPGTAVLRKLRRPRPVMGFDFEAASNLAMADVNPVLERDIWFLVSWINTSGVSPQRCPVPVELVPRLKPDQRAVVQVLDEVDPERLPNPRLSLHRLLHHPLATWVQYGHLVPRDPVGMHHMNRVGSALQRPFIIYQALQRTVGRPPVLRLSAQERTHVTIFISAHEPIRDNDLRTGGAFGADASRREDTIFDGLPFIVQPSLQLPGELHDLRQFPCFNLHSPFFSQRLWTDGDELPCLPVSCFKDLRIVPDYATDVASARAPENDVRTRVPVALLHFVGSPSFDDGSSPA